MKRLYDWAVKLPLIRSLMKISIFAKLLSYEVVIYVSGCNDCRKFNQL